ncbi:MAG: hypothetical protein JXM71_00020, partial [Spirochaetales bacterium]|nr:hypothetical protein [Spirochaetales bacterium]
MKGFRRFLGFALYLFMALPLTFSGLFLSSVRPLADDPSKIKALVSDARFAALLESPDLIAMAPETLRVDGMPLDGKAAAVAFQASIPAHVVVNVAEGAIDTAFEALRSGDASFQIDATPFKRAAIDGASRFADAYLAALATPGTSTAVSTGTVSTGTVST